MYPGLKAGARVGDIPVCGCVAIYANAGVSTQNAKGQLALGLPFCFVMKIWFTSDSPGESTAEPAPAWQGSPVPVLLGVGVAASDLDRHHSSE